MSSVDWPLEDKTTFYDEIDLLDKSLESDDEVINDDSRQKSRAFFQQATVVNSERPGNNRSRASSSQRPEETTLEFTSVASTTLPASQEAVHNNPRRFGPSPSSTQDKSDQEVRAPAVATLNRSLTSPAIVAQQSPSANQPASTTAQLKRSLTTSASPSEQSSSFTMAGNTMKRKRTEKTTFLGKRLLYIRGERVGLRKKRMELAEEHGATIVKTAKDAPDYIVVDAELTYEDIKKIVDPAIAHNPKLVIVKDEWPLICMEKKQIIPVSPRYQVKRMYKEDIPTVINEPTQSSSQASTQSLQIKMTGNDPQRSEKETSPQKTHGSICGDLRAQGAENAAAGYATTETGSHGTAGVNRQQQESPVLQRQNSGFDDELSTIMDHVRQEYKDVPRIGEEDAILNPAGNKFGQQEDDDSGTEDEKKTKKKKKAGLKPSKSKTNQATFEENFACSRGGTETEKSNRDNPNALVISVLSKMLDYYSQINDHWRVLAYRKAIGVLSSRTERITTAEQAIALPQFGKRLAAKLEEIVQTQTLQRLEFALNDPTSRTLSLFLGIYGVGQTTAEKWIAQGFRTLDDLVARADLNHGQRIGIEHYVDLNSRIPRAEVTQLGEYVIKEAKNIDSNVELLIGGSYRRGAASSGDIDFIVTKKGTTSCNELKPFLDQLVSNLRRNNFLTEELATSHQFNGDGSKWHGCCVLPYTPEIHGEDKGSYRAVWRRIDFLLVPESEFGAALIYFTGNDIFNRSMRLLASKKRMRLNQRGLYRDVMRHPSNRQKITEGELLEGRSEKRIFELLGVKWREPSQRWC